MDVFALRTTAEWCLKFPRDGRIMKKIPRKLVWTLGIILGLLLVITIGLRLFFPAEKVKDMAVSMASEKLGREITVADVGLSFAGGLGVQLEDFTVANPHGFAGDPLLVADHIDLKLQIVPLLRGDFKVNRLVVDQPRRSLKPPMIVKGPPRRKSP